ncbi:hypothetical protein NPIL_391791 [Nephila pilipes]|uniref:Uncharacterized protein n=1 Tax=Nephila pilipes TaxID=299642 RepID=A0A8X6QUW8_NEPPI|nr:hypothetical protein NPIL_391791 [Nephila pilipes]
MHFHCRSLDDFFDGSLNHLLPLVVEAFSVEAFHSMSQGITSFPMRQSEVGKRIEDFQSPIISSEVQRLGDFLPSLLSLVSERKSSFSF